jgi:hypothetical protein
MSITFAALDKEENIVWLDSFELRSKNSKNKKGII